MTPLRRFPALLRRTVASGWNHRLLGLSAEAAFWQLLSLPSLFLAGLASLGYASRWFGIDANSIETNVERSLGRAFSQDVVSQIVTPTLREILHGQRIDIISIGFVLALWAGSSATATFVNTITIAYGMRDMRGAVRSRLLALWLFLGSVIIGCALLPMLVLGPTLLTDIIPKTERKVAGTIIHDLYYPVVIVLILIGLTSLYHLAPPRRLPWRRGVPGAILAMLVFLLGSAGLRWYISFILDHNHAYGTLATPIAALLFFYLLAVGVLLGAELNAAIEVDSPSPVKPPRVLHPKGWRQLGPEDAESADRPSMHAESGEAQESPPAGNDS